MAGLPAALRISLLGCLWGSAFLFIHISLGGLGALEVATGRLLIALPILVLAAWSVNGRRGFAALRKIRPTLLIGLGLLNCAVPFFLVAQAQIYVPSGVAAIFNSATPLLTVLIAVIAGVENRPGLVKICGLLLGLLGVATMFGFAAGGGPLWARFALLGAAASYAGAFGLARNGQIRRVDGLVVASAQFVIGVALILIPTAVLWTAPPPIEPGTAAGLVALGTLSTAFPYFIYFDLVRDVGPSSSALATYLVPVVGVVLGWIFLGERLAFTTLAGALMVIAGVVLAQRFDNSISKEI